ncbi:Fe-S protein assembly co-chaperone HscB [Deltaproteobacteria bacterium TL4]
MGAQISKKLQCTGCQTALMSSLFCFSCNHLQRLKAKPDYFTVFGLPVHYDIDLNKLESIYEQLVAELHPDFYHNASAEDHRHSVNLSAILNQAYDTLRDPGSRAAYALSRLAHGSSLNERQLPEGFLEEMFALQERIEELTETDQAESALNTIQADLQQRLQQCQTLYGPLFAKREGQVSFASEDLQQIQTQLNTERYLKRLIERCTAILA